MEHRLAYRVWLGNPSMYRGCFTDASPALYPGKEISMSINNLDDLFLHTLQDVYFAENHITKALPKMIKNADSEKLRKLFEAHLEETKGQIERLNEVFAALGEKAKGEKCPAIEGITKEADEVMSQIKDKDTRDAAMIAAAQAVEHYEITRYGTLISWANLLGHKDVAKVLQKTLDEEYGADDKLTKIAESKLNKEAA